MNAMTETQAAHKGLYSALAAAQAEMGRARKDSKNPHFKTSYADLASVMDACMPVLTRHGIAVLQPTGEDAGGRYVETILVHGPTGEMTCCRVPLIVQKNDMQGYGSAVTYARRYGLMSMAGVAADDDDGTAAAKAAPPAQNAQPRKQNGNAESMTETLIAREIEAINKVTTLEALQSHWWALNQRSKELASDPRVVAAKDAKKADLSPPAEPASSQVDDDEIPY